MQENNQEPHFGHYIYEYIASCTIEGFDAATLISSIIMRKVVKVLENG